MVWGVSMDRTTAILTDQIRKTSLPRAKGWPYRFTDSSSSRCRLSHDIWYPARCSAAHKNEPEHGIKVGSKPEFDVFLAQSLYIRPATADRNDNNNDYKDNN